MITSVGQQILRELKSEQKMDVDDKKWWFAVKNIGSVPHFVWHLLKAFATAIIFYPTAILVLSIALMDEQDMLFLLSQPLSEIIQIKLLLIQLSFLLVTVYLGYSSLQYWRNYVNIKQKYQLDNENFYRDQQLQIELIEEVLYRHKLIDRKDA